MDDESRTEPCRPGCVTCERGIRLDKAKKTRDFDYLMKFTEDLLNDLTQVEFDHGYDMCILDGSWESAPQQLIWSLVKALGCEDHIKWKLEKDAKEKAISKKETT